VNRVKQKIVEKSRIVSFGKSKIWIGDIKYRRLYAIVENVVKDDYFEFEVLVKDYKLSIKPNEIQGEQYFMIDGWFYRLEGMLILKDMYIDYKEIKHSIFDRLIGKLKEPLLKEHKYILRYAVKSISWWQIRVE
jgi:hypothetical protein